MNLSFAVIAATYLENWPTALLALSIPHRALPLAAEELEALLAGPLAADSHTLQCLVRLETRLTAALLDFPEGAFLRLGSRSAKDISAAPVYTARQAMLALQRSRRLRDDCLLAAANGYLPTVFLREWRAIPYWAEFRGFMKERKLVGLCQYHREVAHAALPGSLSLEVIEKALRSFFPLIADAAHLESVVFDTFIREPAGPRREPVVTLIEINPFSAQTDGVYFSWTKPFDLDGSFRYHPISS